MPGVATQYKVLSVRQTKNNKKRKRKKKRKYIQNNQMKKLSTF